LTGAIDRMEKAELVSRVPDPDDGRAWRVQPAPATNRRRKEVESALEKLEDACFAALSASERKQLYNLLEKVTASIER
jgi:DNA-binding MarR family transcriptional regulator